MTLEETLIKMREKNDDDKFYPLVESMKRRADKGLMEGVSSHDIELTLQKIEKDKIYKEQVEINLNQELFEINEAVEKYGKMDIDSWTEEEIESAILYEFACDLEMLNERDYELYSDGEERKKKINTALNIGIGAGAAGGIASAAIKKKGLDIQRAAETTARNNMIKSGATSPDAIEAATILARKENPVFKTGLISTAKSIGGGISKGFNTVKNFVINHPAISGAVGGIGLVGLGIGAYKLIQHLRRKREEKLSETFDDFSLKIFSNDFMVIIQEAIHSLSEDDISFLKENGCEDTIELLEMFKNQPQTLDESVTFIDNAGNLKTMLTPDYVKDMHEYNTDTQIAKYEKKKKKRDYKLISEEIDIDSLKKLSEMSIEEILNEDL